MVLNAPKNQYLGDVVHRALHTPTHYLKNHSQTETRVQGPAYKKRFKADSDVACFLKVADPATKDISPATYNTMVSYKQTQVQCLQFNFKGRRRDHIDMVVAKSKQSPGAGTYSIDSINKGYARITSGCSSGRKRM